MILFSNFQNELNLNKQLFIHLIKFGSLSILVRFRFNFQVFVNIPRTTFFSFTPIALNNIGLYSKTYFIETFILSALCLSDGYLFILKTNQNYSLYQTLYFFIHEHTLDLFRFLRSTHFYILFISLFFIKIKHTNNQLQIHTITEQTKACNMYRIVYTAIISSKRE